MTISWQIVAESMTLGVDHAPYWRLLGGLGISKVASDDRSKSAGVLRLKSSAYEKCSFGA